MFEFLEPPILELKLTNAASDSCLIPERLLSGREGATVIVKKDGQPAREYVPYAEYCFESSTQELSPGRSAYEPLAPFARLKGLDLAEPGYFTVQVCLHLGNTDVLSNALRLRITPPRGYDEEYLAQDFLTDDVGRVLAMGGSRFLEGANDTFREVAAKLPDRRVAIHAQLACSASASPCRLGATSSTVLRRHLSGTYSNDSPPPRAGFWRLSSRKSEINETIRRTPRNAFMRVTSPAGQRYPTVAFQQPPC